MALHWNVSKVDAADNEFGLINKDEDGRGELHPVTHSMIWATMTVGIGAITEKTVEEFAARLDLWQRVNGALMRAQDEATGEWSDRPITRDEVRAHIGLECNVGWETRTKWLKRTITSEVFSTPDPKF